MVTWNKTIVKFNRLLKYSLKLIAKEPRIQVTVGNEAENDVWCIQTQIKGNK